MPETTDDFSRQVEDLRRKIEADASRAYSLTESDRQAIVVALAKLSHSRPGWQYMLSQIAAKLDGGAMYEDFRTYGPDPI